MQVIVLGKYDLKNISRTVVMSEWCWLGIRWADGFCANGWVKTPSPSRLYNCISWRDWSRQTSHDIPVISHLITTSCNMLPSSVLTYISIIHSTITKCRMHKPNSWSRICHMLSLSRSRLEATFFNLHCQSCSRGWACISSKHLELRLQTPENRFWTHHRIYFHHRGYETLLSISTW